MPYEEEEDRGCEVKCPKGGGVCGYGSIPISLPKIKSTDDRQQTTDYHPDGTVVCCLLSVVRLPQYAQILVIRGDKIIN